MTVYDCFGLDDVGLRGESVWDHPCDEHYRKVYEKYKAKENGIDADRCRMILG